MVKIEGLKVLQFDIGMLFKFQCMVNYFKGIWIVDGVIYVKIMGQQILIDIKLLISVIVVLCMYLYLFGVKFFRWLWCVMLMENIVFYLE